MVGRGAHARSRLPSVDMSASTLSRCAARPRASFAHARRRSTAASVRVRASSADAIVDGKPTLYDVPVSNNGARVRLISYWKGLEDTLAIANPETLGGLKSDAYLALNPQGKMPLLVLPDGLALPESEVIAQYICDAYADVGPSLIPDDPETRAVVALATRIHDVYVVPIQGCMYRGPMDVAQRAEGVAAVAKQLDALEGVMSLRTDGPFVAGREPSTADAALFPTYVFVEYLLPKLFGWDDVFAGRPRTREWWNAMRADTCGARVYDEVRGGLEAWDAAGRWAKVGIEDAVKDDAHRWSY